MTKRKILSRNLFKFLDAAVEMGKMQAGAVNAIKNSGLFNENSYLENLLDTSFLRVWTIKNFGKKSMKDLVSYLSEHQLKLK